ncbi:hypothetical protein QBC40DRAFT_313522 [Triangularia verruculosa]|uniref:Uncharacterized protein n=1 Tax=Triangularia verruculosa TaxID=2587418 RepID=A0AAN6XPA3_9PEZI|nr:hypothetical protein QBC40DRAFT_313522 [Triangularia verruculosa]
MVACFDDRHHTTPRISSSLSQPGGWKIGARACVLKSSDPSNFGMLRLVGCSRGAQRIHLITWPPRAQWMASAKPPRNVRWCGHQSWGHRFGGYESGRDRSVMARAMRRFLEKDGLQSFALSQLDCVPPFSDIMETRLEPGNALRCDVWCAAGASVCALKNVSCGSAFLPNAASTSTYFFWKSSRVLARRKGVKGLRYLPRGLRNLILESRPSQITCVFEGLPGTSGPEKGTRYSSAQHARGPPGLTAPQILETAHSPVREAVLAHPGLREQS